MKPVTEPSIARTCMNMWGAVQCSVFSCLVAKKQETLEAVQVCCSSACVEQQRAALSVEQQSSTTSSSSSSIYISSLQCSLSSSAVLLLCSALLLLCSAAPSARITQSMMRNRAEKCVLRSRHLPAAATAQAVCCSRGAC